MSSFQVHFFVLLPGTASRYSAGNISNSNMLLLAETHSSKPKTTLQPTSEDFLLKYQIPTSQQLDVFECMCMRNDRERRCYCRFNLSSIGVHKDQHFCESLPPRYISLQDIFSLS